MTLAETADSSVSYVTCETEFEAAPKRKHRCAGVQNRKSHKRGVFAQADSCPHKHGAETVSLDRPSAKTQKVSQARVATSKLEESVSKVVERC